MITPSTPSCTGPLCGAGGHQPWPLGHQTLLWRTPEPTGWWEFLIAETGMCKHMQCSANYPAVSQLPGQEKDQQVGWMSCLCVWAHIKVNVWNNLLCRMLVKLTGCRGFGMIAKLTCSAKRPGWSKASIVIMTVLCHLSALKNQGSLNVPVPKVLDGIISKLCGPHPRTIPEAKKIHGKPPGITVDINLFKIYKLTNTIKCPRNKQPADLTHSAISPRGWHF